MNQTLFDVQIYKASYPNLEEVQQLANSDLVKGLTYSQFINQYCASRPPLVGNSGMTTGHWHPDAPAKEEHMHKHEKFQNIVNFIETQAKIYWDNLGWNPNVSPKIVNSWMSKQGTGGSVDIHGHPGFQISGVFYLDATPEQGNIVFDNPLKLVLSQNPYMVGSRTEKFLREVESNTGVLLLWPGWLEHSVKANQTDRDRYSFVVNFKGVGQNNSQDNYY